MLSGLALWTLAVAAQGSTDVVIEELKFLARHQAPDGLWGERAGCSCPVAAKRPEGDAEAEPDTKATVDALIRRLSDDRIESRSGAERELVRVGRPALVQLRAAASASDAETAARCRGILDRLGGWPGGDAGLTGLAILSFLGAGYSHLSKDEYDGICFGTVVRRGLVALQRRQGEHGAFDPDDPLRNVAAALAMSEAYGLTGSSLWTESAKKGLASVERAVSPDVRLTAWKSLAARSGSLEEIWKEKTESVRAIRERLTKSEGPTALAGTVILEAWLDRRRGGLRAEGLAGLDPGTLGTEELFFTSIAMRAAWNPSEATCKDWMDKLRERVIRRDAPSRCGILELSTTIRESTYRTLTLEAYYRYGNALIPGGF